MPPRAVLQLIGPRRPTPRGQGQPSRGFRVADAGQGLCCKRPREASQVTKMAEKQGFFEPTTPFKIPTFGTIALTSHSGPVITALETNYVVLLYLDLRSPKHQVARCHRTLRRQQLDGSHLAAIWLVSPKWINSSRCRREPSSAFARDSLSDVIAWEVPMAQQGVEHSQSPSQVCL